MRNIIIATAAMWSRRASLFGNDEFIPFKGMKSDSGPLHELVIPRANDRERHSLSYKFFALSLSVFPIQLYIYTTIENWH